MSRVTYKMVKEWVHDSAFGQLHGCRLISENGYYKIYDGDNEIMVSGQTPLECWRNFNLIKQGWYMREREDKINARTV